MSLLLQVLQPHEIDEILQFEQGILQREIPDESDRMLKSWSEPWRRESLEHYLPLGWSFSARTEGELEGYFIAQPFLFMNGQTQSLWVEHVQFINLQVRDELCDLAYRLSREKHLQKVYFPQKQNLSSALSILKAEAWLPQVAQVKTTKT